MMRLNLPLTGPEELDEIAAVMATGYLTQGPVAGRFERLVADYVHLDHTFATSSCTTALHLALVALGVAPGDEVIVPDFTFPATANAVVQQGATPVLVDIDPMTFNLDAEQLSAAITDRTTAVIAVDAFGLCADMDTINLVAKDHGIPVLEDAACALGGVYHGRAAGALSTVGAFSFHPRKIITTGEGGMLTTDDDGLASKVAVLRSHGGVRGELFLEFHEAGFNYRLSDINAAIGVAQMARLDALVDERRSLARQLTGLLADVPGVTTPTEPAGVEHTYQSYVVLLDDKIDRDRVIRGMGTRGIETTLGTYALHAQPYFQRTLRTQTGRLPNSARVFRQSLTLPLYPQLSEDDLARVAAALRETLTAVA